MNGSVYGIFTTDNAGNEMQPESTASLIAGKGIKGDRYFYGKGTFSELLKNNLAVELTLIEKEEIDKFNISHNQNHNYSDLRRNIVTEGFRLNNYVDKEFSIGKVKLKGIRLCEPCTHLAETVNSLVLPHMIGVSGLRAQTLSSVVA